MLRNAALASELRLPRRLLAIVGFTALTALSAQLEVRIGDFVPFTMQVFAVLLAGLVLGPRDGALSQLLYLLLIRLNLPLAAGGAGAAALLGPTAGYLLGFVPAAYVTGWLAQRVARRGLLRWLAGLAGVAVIYLCGLTGLLLIARLPLADAWAAGAAPFIGLDAAKAALAALLAQGAQTLRNRP
jgi:biotin transport system substrate-specific component